MSAGWIVGAAARELGNGLWRDGRRRAVLLFALGVNLLLGAAGGSRLRRALATWQAAGGGETERGLLGLTLAFGLAVAGVGWIALRERAFGDRARLLFALPLEPATRARALAGESALQLAGGFGLTLGVAWSVLLVHLGGGALPWIALQLGGAGVALGLTFWAQMAWSGSGGRGRARLLAGLATAVAAAAFGLGSTESGGLVGVATGTEPRLHPWYLAMGMWAILALLGGPLAGVAGALYQRAFQSQEEGAGRGRPRPLLAALSRPLTGWRGPSGALLRREILIRGRSWIEWLRAALFGAALLLAFPWLRPLLATHGLPGALGVVAAVGTAALLLVFDGATSPLGAEGSRLLHFLAAPLPLRALLRAKVLALLLPLAVAGALSVAAVGLRSGLPAASLLWAEGAAALVLAGIALVFALGSAWDVDLELEIESGLRGFVQETAPTTTVRMALVAAASLVALLQIGLLARLTPAAGLAALAAFDGGLALVLLGPAERALRRQLSGGV